jgi:hypothetical protein
MPDGFARKLLAAYRGSPAETTEFWDLLEEMGSGDLASTLDLREPLDRRESGCYGYRTQPAPPDQDDQDGEELWL